MSGKQQANFVNKTTAENEPRLTSPPQPPPCDTGKTDYLLTNSSAIASRSQPGVDLDIGKTQSALTNRQGFFHREADEKSLLDEVLRRVQGERAGWVRRKIVRRGMVGMREASRDSFSSVSAQHLRGRVLRCERRCGRRRFEMGERGYRREPGGGHSAKSVVCRLPQ